MVTSESFSARVTRLAGELTPNQLKAARYFRQNATMTLTSSTSLIAIKVGVSTASVIRTAQSLGYAGFPELKQALADELNDTGTEPRKLMGRRISGVQSGRSSLFSVLEDSIATLDEATTTIDETAWDEAVTILSGSSETFVYGVEEAGHLGEVFAHHMRTFGFKAQANRHTGRSLSPFVTSLRGSVCVVLFAPLRVFPEIKEIFAYAKAEDVRTILVTEIVDTSFANEDSVILTTPSTVLIDTENILAPLAVAYSLAHDVANRSSSSSMEAYNEMIERRDRL